MTKISKEEADYRAFPSGRERCVLCTMYKAMGSCTLVDGAISAHGWCMHYEKKAQRPPFSRSE